VASLTYFLASLYFISLLRFSEVFFHLLFLSSSLNNPIKYRSFLVKYWIFVKQHILTCTKLSHDGMFQRNLIRIGQNVHNSHSCYMCAFFPVFNHQPFHLNSCILVLILANLNKVWLVLMYEEWQKITHRRKEPQFKLCVCQWNFYFKVVVLTEHHSNLKVWGVTCCLVVKGVNMQKFNRMKLVNGIKISLYEEENFISCHNRVPGLYMLIFVFHGSYGIQNWPLMLVFGKDIKSTKILCKHSASINDVIMT
jgi:hypothetical protein